MPDRPLSALIIATSSGATMRSERPKPLHLLCGKPMLAYVLDALGSVDVAEAVVVTGAGLDRVSKRIMEKPAAFPMPVRSAGTQPGFSRCLPGGPDRIR